MISILKKYLNANTKTYEETFNIVYDKETEQKLKYHMKKSH